MTGAEATLLAGVVAGVSAAAAAGFAALGTYKATDRSVDAQRQHEDRRRLVEAYVDLVWLVQTNMSQVEAARPRIVVSNLDTSPEVAYIEETRIRARVETLGSAAVRSRLLSWLSARIYFTIALGQLDEIAGGPDKDRPANFPAEQWAPIRADLEARRVALRVATEALENLVRAELELDTSPLAIPPS